MKRCLLIVLSLILLISLCGCGTSDTQSTVFTQEVTIVKMPSPSKCKTSDEISTVDEIIAVLGEVEKTPLTCGIVDSPYIMIKINVDGQNFDYTIGGDCFTDSDGKQYGILNYSETKEKIMEIYDGIDTPETDYT